MNFLKNQRKYWIDTQIKEVSIQYFLVTLKLFFIKKKNENLEPNIQGLLDAKSTQKKPQKNMAEIIYIYIFTQSMLYFEITTNPLNILRIFFYKKRKLIFI